MIRTAFAFLVLILSFTGLQAGDAPYTKSGNSLRDPGFESLAQAPRGLDTASALTERKPHYILPQDLDLTRILAPPPGPDSPRTGDDLRVLLELQANRTPQMVAEARADVESALSRLSDAVGTDLSKARAPLANALMEQVRATARPIVGRAKTFWQRPRPYVLFPQVQPVLPLEKSYSYPSGHTTYGTSIAIILADMVPEKAEAIFTRGRQYGWNRVVGGVHYPSDVEAGRLAGTAITALILRSPAFQEDFKAARAEVRALLGLPLAVEDAPAGAGAPPLPAAAAPAR